MKKFICALLALVAIVAIMASCTSNNTAKVSNEKEVNVSMFIEVERTDQWRVVYHKETEVMYTVNDQGVFTVLVDRYGFPLIWGGGK